MTSEKGIRFRTMIQIGLRVNQFVNFVHVPTSVETLNVIQIHARVSE